MKKNTTIGIIGLGSIGRRHATNLWKHMGFTEIIGHDIELKDKVGWVCGDLDFLIKMSAAFVVCSPTDTHWKHLSLLAPTGKPIFMEKPIADNLYMGLGDAVSNVKMVGYNLRFHSCVKKAKTWVDDKFIGKPLWANFTLGQFSEKPPYLRDGVILNWSHEIDLCLYLLGHARLRASSTRLTGGKDDIADILLEHDSGCHSTVHLDYVTSPEVRQFIIVGSEATIICDLLHRMAWLRDKNDVVLDQFQGQDDWNDNYIEEMQAFLDRINGKETLGCTANEAIDVLKICLNVRKNAGLT